MPKVQNPSSLYDRDFLRWTEDTVSKLKAQNFLQLDLENLIEEVDALGRSQKKELKSRLTTLLEHLLKRTYVRLPENYSGWERTIREQRRQITFLLEDSPSLQNLWEETFDRSLQFALKDLRKEYPQVQFPKQWPYSKSLDAVLEIDFWEAA
jgi:hypothetical protein